MVFVLKFVLFKWRLSNIKELGNGRVWRIYLRKNSMYDGKSMFLGVWRYD